MTWLLTGGAGYIGSHIVRAFRDQGTNVVVLDNLASGYRDFVPSDVPFVEGSVTDPVVVAAALDDYGVTGVVHLAGLKYAGVSVRQPLEFYRENVFGTQVLLEAVVARGIDRFLFSGSSSWYGTPEAEVVDEDAPARPESPYGQTKVAGEWLLRSVAAAHPGLRQCSLRYFNVVGSGDAGTGRPQPAQPVSEGAQGDFRRQPGDHLRHRLRHARWHLRARLRPRSSMWPTRTSGSRSNSTRVAIARRPTTSDGGRARACARSSTRCATVIGIDFAIDEQPRRPGDPARIVGSIERIAADLDWHAQYDLTDMVRSAWAAWQYQLETYGGAPS